MKMKITKQNPMTGKDVTVELNITSTELYNWQKNGTKVQDAFPHLNADEREFLITGIPPGEWDNFLGPLED